MSHTAGLASMMAVGSNSTWQHAVIH